MGPKTHLAFTADEVAMWPTFLAEAFELGAATAAYAKVYGVGVIVGRRCSAAERSAHLRASARTRRGTS